MKRFLFLCLVVGCGGKSDRLSYDNNDLEMLTAYKAKELCSCLFVMQQSEKYCADWTVASPNLASFTIDKTKKIVEASAVVMWHARAHYVNDRFGCVLE